MFITKIMIARAQKCALRDAGMASNLNGLKVQNKNFLPDPGVISDLKTPWEMHIHARLDDHSAPDLSSKSSQKVAFKRGRPWHRAQKENYFYQIPSSFKPSGTASVQIPRSIK
jgi:hypothetical protein